MCGQRLELEDARGKDDYTIREWVDAPGVQYVPVDGELELLPGLRLVPAPGHTRGSQMVVVETDGRPIVVGGDVAVWFGELDEPHTEGQLRVLALAGIPTVALSTQDYLLGTSTHFVRRYSAALP